jgi:hypothetical protein
VSKLTGLSKIFRQNLELAICPASIDRAFLFLNSNQFLNRI